MANILRHCKRRWMYLLACFILVAIIIYLPKDIHVWQGFAQSISQDDSQSKIAETDVWTDESTFLIPSLTELSNATPEERLASYWRYVNTLQVLCRNQMRLGSIKDGGKEVCVDRNYRPTPPCLVYSFGINWAFDFDLAVAKKFGCDVHCFDPSINWAFDFDLAVAKKFGCDVHCFDPSMDARNKKTPPEVKFHAVGLSSKTETRGNGWSVQTLKDIRKSLEHENRTVDILKMDIESDEWTSIPNMIASGALDSVKQLQVEFHYSLGTPPNQLHVLRQLYDAGFRIFMRDRNIYSGVKNVPDIGPVAHLMELALVNMKYFSS